MSLVQKLEKGKDIQKPRTIKRGNEDVDLDVYIRNLEHNYSRWADSKSFNKKQREEVDNAYRHMINEYNKGNLTPLLGGGSEHSLGQISNIKDGFDAYGVAQSYFSDILNRQPSYSSKSSESSSKSKYDPSKGIGVHLNPYLFSGRTTFNPDFILQDEWNAELGKRGITNRSKVFLEGLSKLRNDLDNKLEFKSDSDKKQLLASLDALQNAFSDGQITDNERMYLSNLGLNPDEYFFTGESYGNNEDKSEKTEQQQATEAYQQAVLDEQLAQMNQQTELLNLLAQYRNLPESTRRRSLGPHTYNRFDETTLSDENKELYSKSVYDTLSKFADYIAQNDLFKGIKFQYNAPRIVDVNNPGDQSKWRYVFDKDASPSGRIHQILDAYVEQAEKISGKPLRQTPEGHYILKTNNGYATIYDRKNGDIYEKKVTDIGGDPITSWLPEFANFQTPQVQSNKKGGVLRAQFGITVPTNPNETLEQMKARHKKEKEQAKIDADAKLTKEEKIQKKVDTPISESEFSGTDYARLGAAALDLTGIITAFAPGYGTVASGVAGVGSTLTNFGADISEGRGFGESAWTAVKNLGFDTIGLVPGIGGTGKVAKVANTVVKYIPRILSTLATIDGLSNFGEIKKSFGKLSDPKTITHQDLKNINQGLSIFLGLSRGAGNKMRSSAIKSQASKKEDGSLDFSGIEKFGRATKKDGKFTRWSDVGILQQRENPKEIFRNFRIPNPYISRVRTNPSIKPSTKSSTELDLSPATDLKWLYDQGMGYFKKGGSIKKLEIGGVADWYFNRSTNGATGRGSNFESLGGWTDTLRKDLAGNYIVNAGHSNAGNLKEAFNRNNSYTSNSQLVGSDLNNYYTTLGGNLSAEDFVNQYNSNANKIRQFFNPGVVHSEQGAQNVASHNDLFRAMFGTRSQESNDPSLTYNLGWQNTLKDRLGSTTWMRRMDTYENLFDGSQKDRIHTIQGPDGITFQVYKKANGDIGIFDPSKTYKDDVLQPIQEPEATQIDTPQPATDPSKVVDTSWSDKNTNPSVIREAILKYGPNLIGSGRLIGTLRTNRNIYNTMRESMKPMLIDTYERYSPVTGAFSEMQLRNRQGASTLSQSYRPFTSDGSLAAARMLEGQRHANDLQYQGFLSDDKEIKRTQEAALARQEDNMKRRSDVANTNRASINKNRRDLAQLRADFKLKNWNAVNTYLSGIEADAKQNWNDYRNYVIEADAKQATLDMQNELASYQEQIRDWASKSENAGKSISEAPQYAMYIAKQRELQQKLLDSQNQSYSRLFGWPIRTNTTFNYISV